MLTASVTITDQGQCVVSCIQGYSLSQGSNQCLDCTNQVWKPSVILLGSALAGIGLVTLLVSLNLTVSVGIINGFLFFVNVMQNL